MLLRLREPRNLNLERHSRKKPPLRPELRRERVSLVRALLIFAIDLRGEGKVQGTGEVRAEDVEAEVGAIDATAEKRKRFR